MCRDLSVPKTLLNRWLVITRWLLPSAVAVKGETEFLARIDFRVDFERNCSFFFFRRLIPLTPASQK